MHSNPLYEMEWFFSLERWHSTKSSHWKHFLIWSMHSTTQRLPHTTFVFLLCQKRLSFSRVIHSLAAFVAGSSYLSLMLLVSVAKLKSSLARIRVFSAPPSTMCHFNMPTRNRNALFNVLHGCRSITLYTDTLLRPNVAHDTQFIYHTEPAVWPCMVCQPNKFHKMANVTHSTYKYSIKTANVSQQQIFPAHTITFESKPSFQSDKMKM